MEQSDFPKRKRSFGGRVRKERSGRPPREEKRTPNVLTKIASFVPLESKRKTMKSASGKRFPDEAHGPGKEAIRPQQRCLGKQRCLRNFALFLLICVAFRINLNHHFDVFKIFSGFHEKMRSVESRDMNFPRIAQNLQNLEEMYLVIDLGWWESSK